MREHGITHVMNAVDPVFDMPVFEAAFAAGADYLDMAMSLSRPHPERPYEIPGVKLGDEQFAVAGEWEAAGRLALVGMGVEPGLSDVFARYAADHLFSEIDELGTRDGANLVVTDEAGKATFQSGRNWPRCASMVRFCALAATPRPRMASMALPSAIPRAASSSILAF